LTSRSAPSTSSTCELDNHANTCCAGANTLKILDEGKTVTIHGYHNDFELHHDVPIAQVATMWQNPRDGQTYILITNEALYSGEQLWETLLNPNQLQANELVIEDVPRQFDNNSSHVIFVPGSGVTIPLMLRGIISQFDTVKPTWTDYETYLHVVLMSDLP